MARAAATITLLACLFFISCESSQSTPDNTTPKSETSKDETSGASGGSGGGDSGGGGGYALLYATLRDNSQVDLALLMKRTAPEVEAVIKSIAKTCHHAKQQLDSFAQIDPSVNLEDTHLPTPEIDTRDSISSATAKNILFNTGRDFELALLLTQYESLKYLAHMADILAEEETRPARRRFLAKLAEDCRSLHEKVVALIEAPYVNSAD